MKLILDRDLRFARRELESIYRKIGSTAHHVHKGHYSDDMELIAHDLKGIASLVACVLEELPKPKDRS